MNANQGTSEEDRWRGRLVKVD